MGPFYFPNAAGDRLVVGKGQDAVAFSTQLKRIPLPYSENDLFSDSKIELSPGRSFSGVYVPTAAERSGDFSAFSGLLLDPATGLAFSGGWIPTSHLYQPYAFRIRGDSVPQYLVTLPHIAFGGPWKTTILLRNESDTSADATVSYYGDDGNPLSVPACNAKATWTAVTIPAHGQVAIETDEAEKDSSGWAALGFTHSGIKAQGIFLWQNGSTSESVAPVVTTSNATTTMPFDNTGTAFSGYGFNNPSSMPVAMVLRAYGDDGVLLRAYTQILAGFGHTSFLLKDRLPETRGKRGVVAISGGVSPLGFKFMEDGARFTTWLP